VTSTNVRLREKGVIDLDTPFFSSPPPESHPVLKLLNNLHPIAVIQEMKPNGEKTP